MFEFFMQCFPSYLIVAFLFLYLIHTKPQLQRDCLVRLPQQLEVYLVLHLLVRIMSKIHLSNYLCIEIKDCLTLP